MPIYYSANTKGFYEPDVVKYNSLPDDIIEVTKERRLELLKEMNTNNKTLIVQNQELILVERVITWEEIRQYRDVLLTSSDYTQLPDFPAAKKEQWAAYRQLLRDLPQTYATPQEVIWPTQPT